MKGSMICIDGSLHSTGVAIFEDGKLETSFTIKVSSKYKGFDAIEQMVGEFFYLDRIRTVFYDTCVFEIQERRQGDRATIKNIMNLHACCVAVALSVSADKYIPLLPREWKGSVPKKIHNARIAAKYKDFMEEMGNVSNDELDAIGMGDFVLTKYKGGK